MPAQIGGQPILILKEGSSRSRGKDAQRNNIMAAVVIANTIKSAFGPRGMDKMLVDSLGDVTITSDGATILDEIDVQHPAAKMMVEVAKTTDDEVGDGTTSVVIFAGELLKTAEDLLNKNVHSTIIVDGYKQAADEALKLYDQIAIEVSPTDKKMLKKVAMTSMASKVVRENRDYLADIAVDAVLKVAEKGDDGYKIDIEDIEIQKKAGKSLMATQLIEGIAIDKEVIHSGMPKKVEDAKIALINMALEIEKTEFDAQIRIENPDQMQAFLDEEERMMRNMADKIAKTGANVLICQKGIDDMVQHFLAKKKILAVRRAKQSTMDQLAKATGGSVATNIDDLTKDDLGKAKLVEERKLGDDKWVFIEGCVNPKAVSLLIRGGTEKIIDETERSFHDAISVVRDVVQKAKVVAGGGAPEMEVAGKLRKWAEGLSGRVQLAALNFAEALEVIPTTLAENAGLDPIDIIVDMRARHEKGEKWAGVDVFSGEVKDMAKLDVYEPLAVKEQIVKSASEAASMILRIDDVIAASKSAPMPPGGPPGGMPGGMGGDY
ncbi:MAG: TCP-1/cpn60 chaperonin family protein [Candidatus Bathyarchaeota archaeon]|nr:MAG: TCP-1/cpn60 chaperonin family protein [Candidatus Bathyarchaeota archaeon]